MALPPYVNQCWTAPPADAVHPCLLTPPGAVLLLAPHAAELEGLICQLAEALRALASMVEGSISLER